jgi:hypothetical protein
LRKATRLVNGFGMSNYKGNLSSTNSLLPIAFYAFKLLQLLRDEDAVDATLDANRTVMRRWLCSAQFAGVFGGAADSTVVRAIRAIQSSLDHSLGFPAAAISEAMTHRRKSAVMDDERIDEFLGLTSQDRHYRVYLQMLYDDNDWESDDRSREFVFSVEDGKRSVLDSDERINVAQDAQTIANMVLLRTNEVAELQALGPAHWLATRTPEERTRHLLPSGPTEQSFATFFDGRQDRIRARLRNLFPTATALA